eukprot:scaffold11444_cov169-Ochromonas_danica.AAC.1
MTISEDQDPLHYVQWMLGRLHSSMATASNVPSSFSPSLAAVYAFVQSPDMDARSAFVRSVLLLAMSRFSLDEVNGLPLPSQLFQSVPRQITEQRAREEKCPFCPKLH